MNKDSKKQEKIVQDIQIKTEGLIEQPKLKGQTMSDENKMVRVGSEVGCNQVGSEWLLPLQVFVANATMTLVLRRDPAIRDAKWAGLRSLLAGGDPSVLPQEFLSFLTPRKIETLQKRRQIFSEAVVEIRTRLGWAPEPEIQVILARITRVGLPKDRQRELLLSALAKLQKYNPSKRSAVNCTIATIDYGFSLPRTKTINLPKQLAGSGIATDVGAVAA